MLHMSAFFIGCLVFFHLDICNPSFNILLEATDNGLKYAKLRQNNQKLREIQWEKETIVEQPVWAFLNSAYLSTYPI